MFYPLCFSLFVCLFDYLPVSSFIPLCVPIFRFLLFSFRFVCFFLSPFPSKMRLKRRSLIYLTSLFKTEEVLRHIQAVVLGMADIALSLRLHDQPHFHAFWSHCFARVRH